MLRWESTMRGIRWLSSLRYFLTVSIIFRCHNSHYVMMRWFSSLECVALAKTVHIHTPYICPCTWWFPCQNTVYTPYIYGSGQPENMTWTSRQPPGLYLAWEAQHSLPHTVWNLSEKRSTHSPTQFGTCLRSAAPTPPHSLKLAWEAQHPLPHIV